MRKHVKPPIPASKTVTCVGFVGSGGGGGSGGSEPRKLPRRCGFTPKCEKLLLSQQWLFVVERTQKVQPGLARHCRQHEVSISRSLLPLAVVPRELDSLCEKKSWPMPSHLQPSALLLPVVDCNAASSSTAVADSASIVVRRQPAIKAFVPIAAKSHATRARARRGACQRCR